MFATSQLPDRRGSETQPDLTAFSVLAPVVKRNRVAAVEEVAAGPEVIKEKKRKGSSGSSSGGCSKAAAPLPRKKRPRSSYDRGLCSADCGLSRGGDASLAFAVSRAWESRDRICTARVTTSGLSVLDRLAAQWNPPGRNRQNGKRSRRDMASSYWPNR